MIDWLIDFFLVFRLFSQLFIIINAGWDELLHTAAGANVLGRRAFYVHPESPLHPHELAVRYFTFAHCFFIGNQKFKLKFHLFIVLLP